MLTLSPTRKTRPDRAIEKQTVGRHGEAAILFVLWYETNVSRWTVELANHVKIVIAF